MKTLDQMCAQEQNTAILHLTTSAKDLLDNGVSWDLVEDAYRNTYGTVVTEKVHVRLMLNGYIR